MEKSRFNNKTLVQSMTQLQTNKFCAMSGIVNYFPGAIVSANSSLWDSTKGSTIAALNTPIGICESNGTIYVVDSLNNRINKVTKDGAYSVFVASGLKNPNDCTIDPYTGNLYVGKITN